MKLAALNLAAGAPVELYQVPAARRAIVTVSLCNRAAGPAKVRLALTGGDAPGDADWIEYDTSLTAAGSGGVLERTGIALGAGQAIWAQTDTNNVSIVAFGIVEEVA